jgi:hypothetical protein
MLAVCLFLCWKPISKIAQNGDTRRWVIVRLQWQGLGFRVWVNIAACNFRLQSEDVST